jgi:FAD/FMN-containing dehydrogenase
MSGTLHKELTGWGRYPRVSCELARPERYADLRLPDEGGIVRGQGRAYGDAALNGTQRVVLSERLNRLLDFNEQSGVLRAEAGLTIEELLAFSVPLGWFVAVTPGTKYVSLGGCVAADVHGKNHHHDGAFSSSVRGLSLTTADGQRMWCSRDENSEAFWATVGGMGLTGVIGEVELQLIPIETAYIRATHHKARNLEHAIELFEQYDDASYSVAWIDLLARGKRQGRSVVMLGEHAGLDELQEDAQNEPLQIQERGQRRIPFDMPAGMLNRASIGVFNGLYYRVEGGKSHPFVVDYDKYFYPLDALSDWNRLYGKPGFLQYQCVVPRDGALESLTRLLDTLAASKYPAFLGVLKKMGAASGGLLSFPMEGYTLAMDLPYRGEGLLQLLQRFDEIVMEAGGRLYLAKDARMSSETMHAMYPSTGAFLKIKGELDPEGRFSSELSRRLGLG